MKLLKYSALSIMSLYLLTFVFVSVKYPETLVYVPSGGMTAAVLDSYNCSDINTLCVDDTPGSTQEYANIQACANVVTAGQTCLVYPGEYFGNIVIKSSGSAGSPITFKSAVPRGAVITTNNQPDSFGISDSGTGKSWLIFDGFEFKDIGGYADNDPVLDQIQAAGQVITNPSGGTGIRLESGNSIIIRNSYFNEVGQWLNRLPFSGTNSITGTGIFLKNVQDVLVDKNEFTRMRVGVSVQVDKNGLVSNVEIKNSDFHNYLVWAIDIAPLTATGPNLLQNISIDYNKIHDYAEYDAGNWQGGGEKPHTDGIFLRSANMISEWKNINIFSNEFYTLNPGNSQGGTAAIYVSEGPSANIYNNLFYQVSHSRTIGAFQGGSYPAGFQAVNIFNNVFYNTPQLTFDSKSDPSKSAYVVKNNIFYDSLQKNKLAIYVATGTPPILDNNLYFNPLYPNVDYIATLPTGSYLTLSAMKNLGFEPNGLSSDPLFEKASEYNFRLLPGSPCIDKGADLDKYFSKDITGTGTRTAPWDIGAYEYTGTVTPPVTTTPISTTTPVIPPPTDTTPAVISLFYPVSSLPDGTTEITLSLSTDEGATCKYSKTANTDYNSMTLFPTTGARAHSATITGLTDGSVTPIYTKCQDLAGNINPTDFLTNISVLSPLPIAPACNYDSPTWSTCDNGSQSRTLNATNQPCTGQTTKTETQSCTVTSPTTPTTCTTFTYSKWGTCTNGIKTRTVLSSSPTGCTGGTPSLTMSCTSAVGKKK